MGSTQKGSAQVIKPGEPGKTYFDSTYNQIYEVFHYLIEYHFLTDPKTNKKTFIKAVPIKDGPYISYYREGEIASTGFYAQNAKDSTWKYYKKDGTLIKTEMYRDNQLVP
ncbi:MAG: hypothetical protein Q8M15_02445 [Bacteroidota bacterium]|nr:hypothetical protein [Bacteroidota bacterium]